jgi:hypothetical protein
LRKRSTRIALLHMSIALHPNFWFAADWWYAWGLARRKWRTGPVACSPTRPLFLSASHHIVPSRTISSRHLPSRHLPSRHIPSRCTWSCHALPCCDASRHSIPSRCVLSRHTLGCHRAGMNCSQQPSDASAGQSTCVFGHTSRLCGNTDSTILFNLPATDNIT